MPSVRLSLAIVACAAIAACSSPSSPNGASASVSASAGSGMAEVTGVVPAGAIVSLLPASGENPLPPGPAVMDQYAKQFVPAELLVRVGQPVEFRNTDDLGHNVNVHRRGSGASVFDVETDPQHKYVHTFERAGQYDVACSEHLGMQATILATESALTAVSGNDGTFSIANVPAGRYKVSVMFEGRTVEQAVDVTSPRTEVHVAR